jgi:hypothetical protein
VAIGFVHGNEVAVLVPGIHIFCVFGQRGDGICVGPLLLGDTKGMFVDRHQAGRGDKLIYGSRGYKWGCIERGTGVERPLDASTSTIHAIKTAILAGDIQTKIIGLQIGMDGSIGFKDVIAIGQGPDS